MMSKHAPFEKLPEAGILPVSDITTSLGETSLQAVISAYQEQGFTPPFELLKEQEVASLLEASKNIPFVDACIPLSYKNTDVEIIWGSQAFPKDHPVHHFFSRPEFIQFITDCTGGQPVAFVPQCWSSFYRTSEYIEPHKDPYDGAHLIVCGRAPAGPENGGSLGLHLDDGRDEEAFLTPGKAILLDAKNIEHHVTPLKATEADPSPLRYAWIARYFTRKSAGVDS